MSELNWSGIILAIFSIIGSKPPSDEMSLSVCLFVFLHPSHVIGTNAAENEDNTQTE